MGHSILTTSLWSIIYKWCVSRLYLLIESSVFKPQNLLCLCAEGFIFFDIKTPERLRIHQINKVSNLILALVISVINIFPFIYLKRTTNMFHYVAKNSGFNTCLALTDIESILLSNLPSGHYSLHQISVSKPWPC